METVRQRLREFVLERFSFRQAIADHDSFYEKGILDSTAMMELVSFIECEFGITVEDGDLIPENLDSIQLAAEFVSRKLAVQKPAWVNAA